MELLVFACGLGALFFVAFMVTQSGGIGGGAARSRARSAPPLPAARSTTPLPSGADPLAEIEAFHANELNAITMTVAELTPDLLKGVSFHRLARSIADKHAHLDRRANEGSEQDLFKILR